MATGFTAPVLHSPARPGNAYAYRGGVGMVKSAEHAVLFDDFSNKVTSNVPAGWEGAVIDTGATVTTYTTLKAGTQGVISLASTTASEGAAIYLPKSVQITAGKKFFIEARIFTDDVSDNAVQMGLSDLTATTNPEDLWTTTAANVAAWGILDGSAYPQLLADKSNAGTAALTQTERALSASTWHVLGLGYDGSVLKAFVDGKLATSTTTTIPTDTLMAPFLGFLNGNGAGGNLVLCDYFRYAVER